MVDAGQIQAYLKGISRRYEQWRQDNALTDTIAHQQATFTFNQFVQTEEKQSGIPSRKSPSYIHSLKASVTTYWKKRNMFCSLARQGSANHLLFGSISIALAKRKESARTSNSSTGATKSLSR
jgi:hypothetical protein